MTYGRPTIDDIEAALIAANGNRRVASIALGYNSTYINRRGTKEPKINALLQRIAPTNRAKTMTGNTNAVKPKEALEQPLTDIERMIQPDRLRPLLSADILDAVKDADRGDRAARQWLDGNPAYRLYCQVIDIPALSYDQLPPRSKRVQVVNGWGK